MNGNSRHLGVKIADHADQMNAPPLTVRSAVELTPILVEYADEKGILHTTVAFRAGPKVFLPPQGEAWTTGFRQFATTINEQICEKLDVQAAARAAAPDPVASVPSEDAVTIGTVG